MSTTSTKLSTQLSANKMARLSPVRPTAVLLFLTLVAIALSTPINSSGVFELELVDFKRFDLQTGSKTNDGQQIPSDQLIRLHICLKEAFTSQLDGPCTFGNASITLNSQTVSSELGDTVEQQLRQANQITQVVDATTTLRQQDVSELQAGADEQQLAAAARNQSFDQSDEQLQVQLQHVRQQGSPATNLVRILFTFRWTKSFTIILTAEQISVADQQPRGAAAAATTTATQISTATINQQRTNGSFGSGTEADAANRTATGAAKLSPQPPAPFFDRHVLTENEVLPNLESNPNKFWTKRFSRGPKSALAYRFRVYCASNHFGDGCNTFCRPHDDKFGHYNCSAAGQKSCLDGWRGPSCDRPKCRSGCSHGTCDVPDTCQCRPGWTGSRCDECLAYPGCVNGYCLTAWQCTCRQGWGGVLCDQNMDHCGAHEPCRNNGTCQNLAPGRYRCTCPDGFTGVNCETSLSALFGIAGSMTQLSAGCALNPCLNGGTCFGLNSLASGGGGGSPANEQIEPPSNQILPFEQRQYRCLCPSGWTGDFCQWQDSALELLPPMPVAAEGPNLTFVSAQEFVQPDERTLDSAAASGSSEEPPVELVGVPSSQATQTTSEISMPIGQTPTLNQTTLDMRHLISGVVIASVIGVFLAVLSLTWCCLIAIERNGFSFIQMNIIKSGGSHSGDSADGTSSGGGEQIVSATLRRMHNKIRDSFRRRRATRTIKPQTKLSIENVLRQPKLPPPSYEESNYNVNKTRLAPKLESCVDYSRQNNELESDETCPRLESQLSLSEIGRKNAAESMELEMEKNLVKCSTIRGALEEKIAFKSAAKGLSQQFAEQPPHQQQYACPRHAHLYSTRNETVSSCDSYSLQTKDEAAATSIEIEYQPETSTTRTSSGQQHYRHQLAPDLLVLASGSQYDLARHKQQYQRREEPPPL